jgi:GDPmannose 4,6-dehydratase
VDSRLVRHNEIHNLRADARLAREELGWTPAVDFGGLVRLMVESDLAGITELASRDVTGSTAHATVSA